MRSRELLKTLAAGLLTMLVCVHPGFSATTNLFPVADTSLMETFPTNNLGGAAALLAGTGENLKRHRALLRFDIAGQLPARATIKSAGLVLELAWIPANGYAPSGMGLHRVLQPWGEGNKLSPTNCSSCQGQGSPASTNEATWLDRLALTTNAWSTPGAAATNDYVAAASAAQIIYQFADSPYGFGSAQMAADVQLWLDNPGTNFGWILIGQAEAAKFTARRFFSREDRSFPPYLAIEYLIAPRIESAQKVGNQFNLTFTALPGQSYVVEFRDGFSTGTWQTLANVGSVADNTRVVVVDTVAAAQRYYRIRSY